MYKYCPKCTGKLAVKSPSLFVCRKCGFNFYLNPIPSTGVLIINRENKVLLVKRKFAPKKGYLDVPGGFIEPGESAEESLKREIKEELGISLKDLTYLSSYEGKYLYQGINYSTLCLMFVAKIKDEKVKIGDDVSGFEWFFYGEIPFQKLAFEFIKQSIDKLFRKSNNKFRGQKL